MQKLLTFVQQNINVSENTSAAIVNEFVINELVKFIDALNNWAQAIRRDRDKTKTKHDHQLTFASRSMSGVRVALNKTLNQS